MPSRLQIPYSMKLPDDRLVELFFKSNKKILTRDITFTGRDHGYEAKANKNKPKPIRYIGSKPSHRGDPPPHPHPDQNEKRKLRVLLQKTHSLPEFESDKSR